MAGPPAPWSSRRSRVSGSERLAAVAEKTGVDSTRFVFLENLFGEKGRMGTYATGDPMPSMPSALASASAIAFAIAVSSLEDAFDDLCRLQHLAA
jgi:hypothetical protein